jgi:hypothetical protein
VNQRSCFSGYPTALRPGLPISVPGGPVRPCHEKVVQSSTADFPILALLDKSRQKPVSVKLFTGAMFSRVFQAPDNSVRLGRRDLGGMTLLGRIKRLVQKVRAGRLIR